MPPAGADSTSSPVYGLEFDGVDAHVEIPGLVARDTEALTWECWLTAANKPDMSIATIPRPDTKGLWRLAIQNHGPFAVRVAGEKYGISMSASGSLAAESLTHVAAAYHKDTWTLWIDGKRVGSGGRHNAWTPSVTKTFTAILGADTGMPSSAIHRKPPFQGRLHQLRILSSVRYDQDFTPDRRFEPDKDTLALYRFDEGTGDVLTDSSGNGYHGKIVNAKWVPGISGGPPAVPGATSGSSEPPRSTVAPPTPPTPSTGEPKPAPVAAGPAKAAAVPKTIRVGPAAGMVGTLKQALADANGGDTIEIATDEPLMITEPLEWGKAGSLTIKAAEGKRPILVTDQTGQPNADVIRFRASGTEEAGPAAVALQGLTFVDRLGTTSVVVMTDRPLNLTDVTCVVKRPTSAVTTSASVRDTVFDRCYFWMQDVPGVSRAIVTLRSDKTTIRQCLFAGYGMLGLIGTSHDLQCDQSTFLGRNAWSISNDKARVKLHIERNLHYGLKTVGAFPQIDLAVRAANPAEYAAAVEQAKQQLVEYRGVNNGYFRCDRMIQNLSAKATNDLAAWQSFTNNGEKNPQFVDPQFVRPEVAELAKTKLLPPKAFALKSTSPLRKLKIGCDVNQLPDLPPRLYDLLPSDMRPDAKLLSELTPPTEALTPVTKTSSKATASSATGGNSPVSATTPTTPPASMTTGEPKPSPVAPTTTTKAAAVPKTIRVGPAAGMVGTLKQALADANGGDTIEIATDEPLMITEPLSWSKPGPLTIKAAEGKRPILVAASSGTSKNVITFAAPSGMPDATRTAGVVTLSGLTIVAVSQLNRSIIGAFRPLVVSQTICVMVSDQKGFFTVYPDAAEVTLERCYLWKNALASSNEGGLLSTMTRNTTVRGCLFAGGGYHYVSVGGTASKYGPQQSLHYEQTTFLNTRFAWQLSGGLEVNLQAERNLCVDLKNVIDFYEPDEAKGRSVQLTQARQQLPNYRGVQNAFFQCERLCTLFSSKAENDLAAWQSFTNNGEKNPQFVDPQFVRPDLVAQVSQKLFPPRAFALKSGSPLRKLKIGCDVTQLPDLPPRLYDLLPAEIRPDAKP